MTFTASPLLRAAFLVPMLGFGVGAHAKLGYIDLEDAVVAADTIVLGRLVKVDEIPNAWSGVYGAPRGVLDSASVATVDVIEVIHGDAALKRIVVLGWRGGDCGYPWVKPDVSHVLLFLWEQDLHDWAASCDDAEPTAGFVDAIDKLRGQSPFFRPVYQGAGALRIAEERGRTAAFSHGGLHFPNDIPLAGSGLGRDLPALVQYVKSIRRHTVNECRLRQTRCPWGFSSY